MTDLNILREDDQDYIIVDDNCWIPDWLGYSVSTEGSTGERFIEVTWLKDLCSFGCASGMYMPAVTYFDAKQTMGTYGDEVLEYITEQHGEVPDVAADCESWGQRCCYYMCMATETWAYALLLEAGYEI